MVEEKKEKVKSARAKYNKSAKDDYLKGESKEIPKTFKKIFTDEETREILENTIRFRKSDKRIYTVICLWLCNLIQSNYYKQLRVLTKNAQIDVLDFNNNHEMIKEVVHSILEEMLSVTPYKLSAKRREALGLAEGEEVMRGLVYQIDWDMPNKQIFKFVMTKVGFALHRAISKLFRSQQATANHFTEKNKEKMVVISHIATSSTDSKIVTNEKIRLLWNYGITDLDLYQYRQVHCYGNFDNFVTLTPELMDRVSYTADTESMNLERMNMRDELCKILNSNAIKRCYRDFLKAKFKIPSIMIENGELKEFIIEMKDFFSIHNEYYKVLNPIIETVTEKGKKVKRYSFDDEYLKNTSFYKEAISEIKRCLVSNLSLEIMQDRVENDDIQLFDGEDFSWNDSTASFSSVNLEKIAGQY
jgi:hypothetical protein